MNLRVIDHLGRTHAVRDVPLLQPGDRLPLEGGYCTWPSHTVEQEHQRTRAEEFADRVVALKKNSVGTAAAALAMLVLLISVVFGGCSAVNTASIDRDGVMTTAQPASLATMSADGDVKATYQGVPPTVLMQDVEGTWMSTAGPGGVLTFNPATGQVYIWSPKDGRIERVKVTPHPEPGQPSFEADLVELNLSTVAAVHAEQFGMAMKAIQGMTKSEAEARVRQMEQARLITSDVAKVLVESVIPLLP